MNKYNISLQGAKQGRIEFQYKNINVVKSARYSLEQEYNDIIRTADEGNGVVEFDMVCRFKLDYKHDKCAKLDVEDWVFRPSSSTQFNPFGF